MSAADLVHSSDEEDVVFINQDDVSNFNDDNILPEPVETVARIQSWLQPTDYSIESGEYRKHLASHFAGTGAWLPETENYRKWHDSPNHGLLWIRGIPGSGKSVFAATLAHRLAEEGVPVLFFFFRQIIDANHQPVNLLRDWLAQILPYSPPLQQEFKEFVEQKRSIETVSNEDLWQYLRMALQHLSRVYCVVDALDEMDQGNEAFIQELANFGHWRPSKIKLLMTSRPVPSVETPMRNIKVVNIRLDERLVDLDIASYVHRQLEDSNIPLHDRELVKKAVPGRANGIFLYAKLAMKAFLEPGAEVSRVLSRLPDDLNALYAGILREHAERSGTEAIQLLILQWATHATRPLRLLELADMLKTVTDQKEEQGLKAYKSLVRMACGPLLEILPDETVSVVHHSLTEFLVGSTRSSALGSSQLQYPVLQFESTHQELASACLKYMRSRDFWRLGLTVASSTHLNNGSHWDLNMKFPFGSYAANNWYLHATRSMDSGLNSDAMSNDIEDFLDNVQLRKQWLKLCWPEKQQLCKDSVLDLHIAAYCGFKNWVFNYLGNGNDNQVDTCDGSGKTALWLAADRGHDRIVEMLLEAGADATPFDIDGATPLHQAAQMDHHRTIGVLLRAGVDSLTARKKQERHGRPKGKAGDAPLMYTCQNGNLECLEVFIPVLNTKSKQKALNWAAGKGHPKLVKRILRESDVDPNGQSNGLTPLFWASSRGDIESMQILINTGASASILCDSSGKVPEAPRDGRGRSALHTFCRMHGSRPDMKVDGLDPQTMLEGVSLLVSAGGDVRQKDLTGAEPFHRVRSTTMAKILLAAGADPNAETDEDRTLIHDCMSKDCSDLLQLLIAEGADINHRERLYGRTPLQSAISRSLDSALRVLEYNPDCNVRDNFGNGPLHLACDNGSLDSVATDVVEALLKAGADPNSRNFEGLTPLHSFTLSNREFNAASIGKLVAHGADVESKDPKGRTVMFRTIMYTTYGRFFRHNMDCFLAVSASMDTRDATGRTLLHEAVRRYENHESVQYFVDHGVDPLAVDFNGNTLFHEAALTAKSVRSGALSWFEGLFTRLRGLGVNFDQPNYSGTTPLHIICQYFHVEKPKLPNALEAALGDCKSVNAQDSQGLRAVHFAASVSQYTVARLIRAGADLRPLTNESMNVLHIAARCRQSNTVGLVLDWMNRTELPQAKAMVNQKDYAQHTPLHYACLSGRPETVDLLLAAGADPNPSFDAKTTPLFPPILQFAKFAAEQKLWEGDRNIDDAIVACGLTLRDTNRPRHGGRNQDKPAWEYEENGSRSAMSPKRPLNVTIDTVRFEEISRMLVAHAADPCDVSSSMFLDALNEAANDNNDYVVNLLLELRGQGRANTKTLDIPFQVRLSEARFQSERTTFFNLNAVVPGTPNLELFEQLVRLRQFPLIKRMYEAGADFTAPASKANSILHLLVEYGFAELLDQCCTPEEAARFEDWEWCAQQETKIERKESSNNNLNRIRSLLGKACQRTLPSLDVLRVLVEKKGSDVNARQRVVPARSSRDQTLKPGSSALHLLASGSSWWCSAQGMPYLVSQGAEVNLRDAWGRTPLHNALKDQPLGKSAFREQAARTLVELGADVTASTDEGVDCLGAAGDNADLIRLFIARGAVVNTKSITAAVEKDNVDALDALLSGNAEVNVGSGRKQAPPEPLPRKRGDKPNRSPLFLAAWFDGMKYRMASGRKLRGPREAMVNLLLGKGADPYDTYMEETPPWGYGSNTKSGSHASAWDLWKMTTMRTDIGRESSDYTSDYESDSETPVNFDEHTVLHDILMRCKIYAPLLNIPDLDLEYRDSLGRTVLHAACHIYNHPPVVSHREMFGPLKILIDRCVNLLAVDFAERNVLHHLLGSVAAAEDKLDCLKLLEDVVPALINKADKFGYYPLHYALASPCRYQGKGDPLEWLQYVVSHGADATVRDAGGQTALHYICKDLMDYPNAASRDNKRPLIKEFVRLGLSMNERNNRGETPLHKCFDRCNNINPEVMEKASEVLDEAGADWVVRDNEGKTLLHRVAAHSPKTFQFVMEKGADPLAEDSEGRTSLDIAVAYEHREILEMFEARGKTGETPGETLKPVRP